MGDCSGSTDKNIVVVLFPGIVKNDQKALQCLGGIAKISQVYGDQNRRLGLSFHPENPFCKSTYADAINTNGILLKVKIKRSRDERKVISTEVVGKTKTIYSFDCLNDFQYLPQVAANGPTSQVECQFHDLSPPNLVAHDWLNQEARYFHFVPAAFTRVDRSSEYSYLDRSPLYFKDLSNSKPKLEEDVIRSYRTRLLPRRCINFSLVDELPKKPFNECSEMLKASEESGRFPNLRKDLETVKKLFEERPLWSRPAIAFKTGVANISLKVILPCVAVYYKNGPWRSLWCRFGYDPRKEPDSRRLQTLDYRIRQGLASDLPLRASNRTYQMTRNMRRLRPATRPDPPAPLPPSDVNYVLRPGRLPVKAQIFYQYCDILLPEVQELLDKAGSRGASCHQRRGWLPPRVEEQVRGLLDHFVDTLMAREGPRSMHVNVHGYLDDDGSDDDGDDDDLQGSEEEADALPPASFSNDGQTT